MALTFEVGITDNVSSPAERAAASMASAASKAQVLSSALLATDAALLKASAIGASSASIAKLERQHSLLASSLAKVSPAAQAEEAALAKATASQERFAAAGVAAGKAIAKADADAANAAKLSAANRAAAGVAAGKAIAKADADAANAAKLSAANRTAAAAEQIKALGIMRDTFGAAANGAKEFFGAIVAGDAGGAVKGLGDTIAGASRALDLLVPGLGQLTSAVLSVASSILGAGVGALQSMAEKSLSATETLRLLTSQLEALSGGVATGDDVVGVVDEIARQTGAARDSVGALARSFESIGINDLDKLETALLASRSATALVGEGGGQAFESLTRKIQTASEAGTGLKIATRGLKAIEETGARASDVAAHLGITVVALAAQLKAGTQNADAFGDALQQALIDKGAGPLETVANSVTGLTARFHNAVDKLFEGANAEPFLDQLAKTVDLFDDSTASGQAMKLAITETTNAIFEGASRALPILREFFLDVLVEGIKVLEFAEEHADGLSTAFDIVAGTLGAVGAIAIAAADAIMLPFQLAGDAYTAAGNFVDGFVGGITDGVSRIVGAAENAAQSALDAVKDTLGIHSPSTVMIDVGGNVAAGMAQGIQGGQGEVAQASRQLGRSPMVEAGNAAGGGGSGAGGGTVNHLTVHVQVTGDGKGGAELSEEIISLTFERLSAMQGLGSGAPA